MVKVRHQVSQRSQMGSVITIGLAVYASFFSTNRGRTVTIGVFRQKRSTALELSGPTAIVTALVVSRSNVATALPEVTSTTSETIFSPLCTATRKRCLPRSPCGICDASIGTLIVLILLLIGF